MQSLKFEAECIPTSINPSSLQFQYLFFLNSGVTVFFWSLSQL